MANFNLKVSRSALHDDESHVLGGLAVTPADMERMTITGKAIAAATCEQFAYYPPFTIATGLPLAFRRSMDINTAWEATQVSRSKLSAVAKTLNV